MFSSHAADILKTYGTTGSRLESWRSAFAAAEPFLDESTGAHGLVIHREERPSIVILREKISIVSLREK